MSKITRPMTESPTPPRAPTAEREQAAAGIESILSPKSIAVIGASPRPGNLGHEILRNIISTGFGGATHPIHPSATSVLSRKAYPTILDAPGEIDLAVIVVPANECLNVVDECGAKGVKGLVVISAGFREVGPEGEARERQLHDIVRRHGMRMVGPNCLGVVNNSPAVRLNATFAPVLPSFGRTALITQSGALGIAVLERAARLRLGLARFVSMGNKTNVSGNDLLLAWEDDPEVGQILMYIESFGNPRNFLRIARRVGKKKPILVLKSGRSAAGARAAGSHTGALAESDKIVEALFEQCGVLRASTIEELFDDALALDRQPLPLGPRVAVVTNSGGPGIMAADALEGTGLKLATLGDATIRRISPILPPHATASNPLDLLAAGGPRAFQEALQAVLKDPTVDAAVAIYTPPIVTNDEEVAHAVIEARRQHPDKPLLAVFLGRQANTPAVVSLLDEGIPVYEFPENAIKALSAMVRLGDFRTRHQGRMPQPDVDVEAARNVLERATADESGWLSQSDAFDLLRAYGIRAPAHRFVLDEKAAVAAAEWIGFPVVLKASAEGLVHKTEAGAIRLNLGTVQQVREAFRETRERLQALGLKPDGALMMAQVPAGRELLLGIQRDPHFGPLVAFGLGGVDTEVHRDVVFRLAPLTDEDARRMAKGLRAAALLEAHRGKPPADVHAIEDALARLSQLAVDFPEITELDVNPFIVDAVGRGATAVDVRIRRRSHESKA